MEQHDSVKLAMINSLQNYFFSRNKELLYISFQTPKQKPRVSRNNECGDRSNSNEQQSSVREVCGL